MNGLVYNFNSSSWQSCIHITNNLKSVYEGKFKNIKSYHYSNELSAVEIHELARAIHNDSLSNLIFIDHNPSPTNIINGLNIFFDKFGGNRPKIHIHVFGDFIHYLETWHESEEILKNFKIKFYAASDKQCEILKKIINDKDLRICPFPVDSQNYQFDQLAREDFRKKYNIKEDDQVFLYSGRFSEQKNIGQLLMCFEKIKDSKKKLFLAGNFDDIGQPFRRGYIELVGTYFNKVNDIYESSEYLKKNVIFLNDLNKNELVAAYSAADCFISLSTYHDEDFGMAVAEAKCSGLPTILTDWAGYSSFKTDNYTELIKVKFTPEHILINTNQAISAIKNFKTVNNDTKKEIAKNISSYCDIETIKELQTESFDSEMTLFQEFKPFFKKLVKENIKNFSIKFTAENSQAYSKNYQELYGPYY